MKYVFLSYLEREDAMNPFIYFNKQNQNWSIVIKEVDENNFQITYKLFMDSKQKQMLKTYLMSKWNNLKKIWQKSKK